MVKSGLAILFLLSGLAVIAQPDPVLMRINGKEVFRSEFEYACRQNGSWRMGYGSNGKIFWIGSSISSLKLRKQRRPGWIRQRFFGADWTVAAVSW